MKISKSDLAPTATLSIERSNTEDLSSTVDEKEQDTIKATVTWPFFSGGKNLAKLNKKLYKKVSALMKEASHLSTAADKKHKEFVDIRKKADNQHSKAMEMLETLRAHRKTANEERQARWKVVKDHRKNIKKELYDPKKLDSVADDALQQLMSGGKINL